MASSARLREGLGADDIAVLLDCDPDLVRVEIRVLREIGALEEIYRKRVRK